MRCVRSLPLLVVLAVLVRTADEPPKKEPVSEHAAKAAEFAAAEAKRYKIRHADDDEKKALEVVAEPVLRWSNPTSGEVYGAVYLWARGGCPEAAASAYQFFDRKQLNIELVSLAEAPMKADRNGRTRWTPEAGLKFAAHAGPAAGDTADKRLLQMKALARQFAGQITMRGETKPSDLRLLAKPLHRYEATDGSGREGAVFAFVTTTDPEILLLIESRKTAAGREWAWAAARMHFRPLQLAPAEKVVWEVPAVAPPWDKLRGPEGQYVILQWDTAEQASKD